MLHCTSQSKQLQRNSQKSHTLSKISVYKQYFINIRQPNGSCQFVLYSNMYTKYTIYIYIYIYVTAYHTNGIWSIIRCSVRISVKPTTMLFSLSFACLPNLYMHSNEEWGCINGRYTVCADYNIYKIYIETCLRIHFAPARIRPKS